jgi:hypothetical protein
VPAKMTLVLTTEKEKRLINHEKSWFSTAKMSLTV